MPYRDERTMMKLVKQGTQMANWGVFQIETKQWLDELLEYLLKSHFAEGMTQMEKRIIQ